MSGRCSTEICMDHGGLFACHSKPSWPQDTPCKPEEEGTTPHCAPENSTPTVWQGRDRTSSGSISFAVHRPLLTTAGCALWDGLNIICLLAQLQVLSEQIPIKPSRYCQAFLRRSAESVMGKTYSATKRICVGSCCSSAWTTTNHHVLLLQVPFPPPERALLTP